MNTVLITGDVAPKHSRPGEEIIYVLEGTLEYQVEGQPTATYKAGGFTDLPGRQE